MPMEVWTKLVKSPDSQSGVLRDHTPPPLPIETILVKEKDFNGAVAQLGRRHFLEGEGSLDSNSSGSTTFEEGWLSLVESGSLLRS